MASAANNVVLPLRRIVQRHEYRYYLAGRASPAIDVTALSAGVTPTPGVTAITIHYYTVMAFTPSRWSLTFTPMVVVVCHIIGRYARDAVASAGRRH